MKDVERLILIDDDLSSNFLAKFVISRVKSSADVRIFVSPEEALQFIDSDYLDTKKDCNTVILVDINFAVMSGWEFLDSFSDFPESIKNQFTLFVFSSSIARRDKEQAKLYSFVSGYIEKPFSKEIAQRIYFSNEDLKIDGEGNSAAASNSVNKLSAND